MSKYRISWTEETWLRIDIEANSMEEALDKFHAGDCDFDTAKEFGHELQDGVDVMEVT